ncbi:hypothetical protein ACWEPH_26950 [Nocardia beijingensis]
MSDTSLLTWANNFATLRRIANSDSAATWPMNTPAGPWRGADRILGPQVRALLPMMMPLLRAGLTWGPAPAALTEQAQIEGKEDLLLFGRYFLEVTALKAEAAGYDQVRSELVTLLDRLETTARAWAATGIDDEQRRILIEETRAAAERIRRHGTGRAA